MCTLIALYRCFAGMPLVIAANRDEYLDRPTEGRAIRETRSGRILAPRDGLAGGTWLGINESGVFAAVTNRHTDAPDPTRRSRGLLVMDLLNTSTAEDAAGRTESLPPNAYNPFNVCVADGRSAHVLSVGDAPGALPERLDLAPGPHVFGNLHPAAASVKVARIAAEVDAVLEGAEEKVLDHLGALCGSHTGATALESTCVHAPGYGTRSSTLFRQGDVPELRHSDGAPCSHAYENFTPLLRELADASVAQGPATRTPP